MDPKTLEHLVDINAQLVDGAPLTDSLRAELATTVQALRQQRARTLAATPASILKMNRPVTSTNPDSYAPVYLQLGEQKILISKNTTGDDVGDRLAACWNFCLGVPLELLEKDKARFLLPNRM